jgi:crossover junction endodeoxyribonuclease RusA
VNYEFFVLGKPAPQGSKRLLGNALVESSSRLKPWRTDCKMCAIQSRPSDWCLDRPIRIDVEFRFKRPKSHCNRSGVRSNAPRFPQTRSVGDVDKLSRALLDACTEVAYNDDSQVVSLNATKAYCVDDQPQGAQVTITLL